VGIIDSDESNDSVIFESGMAGAIFTIMTFANIGDSIGAKKVKVDLHKIMDL